MNTQSIDRRPEVSLFFQNVFPKYYGFILSRSIYVICRLKIAELLEKGPMKAGVICQHLGTKQVAQLERVLNFLASNAIFCKTDTGTYAHTAHSLELKQEAVGQKIIQHQDLYWNTLQEPNQACVQALETAELETHSYVEALGHLYIQSRAIYTAVRLHLFEQIEQGKEIASPIMKHLQAAGLVSGSALTAAGKTLLDPSCQAFILHDIPKRWHALEKLEEALTEGTVPFERMNGMTLFEYLRKHPEETSTFSEAMTFISDYECGALVGELEGLVTPGTTLMDVGGGQGRYLHAVLEKYPSLKGILFDLQENINRPVLSPQTLSRAHLVAGDFFIHVPEADLYLFKRVLHDWSDEECVKILQTLAKSAKPSAKLVLHEFLLPQPEALMLDVYFMSLFKGRQRTSEEFAKILLASGWQIESARQTNCWLGMVIAQRAVM